MSADVSPAPADRDGSKAARTRLREALRRATLGEFEIYDELGRGGMATVFLGYEIALARHVAIKVMAPALSLEDGMSERFQREARIAAGLSHPHIIPVYAVRESEQLSYFVMKYVDGCTLDAIISEHAPLPIELVRQLLIQVGGALEHAHAHGVVHRDVKPANILIDADGWALVTDFGIAKASGLTGLTATGAAVGTPYYMSPEQCLRGEVTGQADQYSLGVVAYQMLCGKVPFRGADFVEVTRAHVMDAPEAISESRSDCPPVLAAAVMQMLSKRPGDRWSSLAAFVQGIRGTSAVKSRPALDQLKTMVRTGAGHRTLPDVPVSPAPNGRRRGRKRPGRSATLMLALVAVGSAGVFMTTRGRTRVGSPAGPTGSPDSIPLSLSENPPIPPPAVVPPSVLADSATGQLPEEKVLVRADPKLLRPRPQQERKVPVGSAADSSPPQSVVVKEWSWVLLGTSHEEAFVYVNGVPQMPKAPSLRWWKVRPGVVTLSVGAEGCASWDTTGTIAPGDSVQIGRRFPTCP